MKKIVQIISFVATLGVTNLFISCNENLDTTALMQLLSATSPTTSTKPEEQNSTDQKPTDQKNPNEQKKTDQPPKPTPEAPIPDDPLPEPPIPDDPLPEPPIPDETAPEENAFLSTIEKANMITIPAGTVTGGPSNIINNVRNSDEKGVFAVSGRNLTIPTFKMGAYEVTQRLYKAVMTGDTNANADPSYFNDKNPDINYKDTNNEEKDLRPVENVTWFDAVYFCNKLSEKTGKVPYYDIINIIWNNGHITNASVSISKSRWASTGYRLPTEAEWEYAARGANPDSREWGYYFAGKESSNTYYLNSDLDTVGWYHFNSLTGTSIEEDKIPEYAGYDGTHRVGLKAPISESLDIYDMSGNVWEWCFDQYDEITTTTPLLGPDTTPFLEDWHVIRGGCCMGNGILATACSITYRSYSTQTEVSSYVGFRICCSLE